MRNCTVFRKEIWALTHPASPRHADGSSSHNNITFLFLSLVFWRRSTRLSLERTGHYGRGASLVGRHHVPTREQARREAHDDGDESDNVDDVGSIAGRGNRNDDADADEQETETKRRC